MRNRSLEINSETPLISTMEDDKTYELRMKDSILKFLLEIKNSSNQEKEIKKDFRFIVNSFCAAIGLSSGIPWISPSMDAAIIIPGPGVSRTTVAIFFAGGTVITVGAIGGYIMYDILPMGEKEIAKDFFNSNDSYLKTAIIAAFSILSCVSPVYATTIYNTGIKRFLSISTAATSLSYGVYAYKRLINKTSNFLTDHFSMDSDARNKKKNINESLFCFLAAIESNPDILLFSEDLEQSIEDASNSFLVKNNDKNIFWAKFVFQLMGDLTIPAATALVSILLSKEAMQLIWDNPTFYIPMTVLAELPSYILSAVSTHNVFGQLFDNIYAMISGGAADSFLDLTYPKLMKYLNIVFLLVALTAPSAAAYITYTTIGNFSTQDENSTGNNACMSPDCLENNFITWGSVGAICLSRYILAVFTQKSLFNELMLFFSSKSADPQTLARANVSRSIRSILAIWDSLEPGEENIEDISSPDDRENKNRGIFSYCTSAIGKITFFGHSDTKATGVEFHEDEKSSKSICILQ